MSRTALHLDLETQLAEDIRAVADLCGMSVEEYVVQLLRRQATDAAESLGWNVDLEEDLKAVSDYEETGLAVPWEEVSVWLKSLATDDPLPKPLPRKLK